jgi:outer membrane protein TolC
MKAFIQNSLFVICLTIVLSSLNFNAHSQSRKSIKLQEIIDSAIINYPIAKQAALYEEQWQTEIDQVKKRNLPQVQFNGKATYQNEVIGLGLNIPGMNIEELSKDQYRFSLDIQQSIYKGNASGKQKELYATKKEASIKQMEVELNQLKRSVIGIFYGLIFNSKQAQILTTYKQQLSKKSSELNSLVENGMALQSSSDAIQLELLKLEQSIIEVKNDRVKLVRNMSELSGLELDTSTTFKDIDRNISASANQQRPEFALMELQQRSLEKSKNLIGAKYLPNIYAFGTAGVGRPGFNYLSNDFADFYMVGIGVNWKLWTWQEGKREKQIIDINSRLIETKKEAFLKSMTTNLNTYEANIATQQELLKKDEKIIEIQHRITLTSEKQLLNEVITSSQYVDELQKEQKYKLEYEIHKIKLNLAKLNWLWEMGEI